MVSQLPLISAPARIPPPWLTGPGSGTAALGLSTHFERQPGLPLSGLDQIRAAGIRHVRLDLEWTHVEQQPGVYNFAYYDALIDALRTRGLQPMIILGSGHPLYGEQRSIRTPQGQAAYNRFVQAAVARYQGPDVLWELWNEPNHRTFWKPQPDVDEYMRWASSTTSAIRQVDPDAVLCGPNTAGMPIPFLKACLDRGLLTLVDAVNMHPYQAYPVSRAPEHFLQEYRQVRALVDSYQPGTPLLLGEWGHSTAMGSNDVDEATQAAYLMRQSLLAMMVGSPLSVWYDWQEDGSEPGNKEHHFGIVRPDGQPKPAYAAMQTLHQALTGRQYAGRLPGDPNDYPLMFHAQDPAQPSLLAAWTTSPPHWITINGQAIWLDGMPRFFSMSAPPLTPARTAWLA
ncbi:MAG: cellulase family glycosylhydrolase [Candidatus Melainabacteria bacterium]